MWYPRKLVMLKQSGRYAVCDRGNERSRMQIFARNGQFVRKVAIRFIEILAGLAVTNEGASSLALCTSTHLLRASIHVHDYIIISYVLHTSIRYIFLYLSVLCPLHVRNYGYIANTTMLILYIFDTVQCGLL